MLPPFLRHGCWSRPAQPAGVRPGHTPTPACVHFGPQERERREREELLSTDRIQAIDATAISIDDEELEHHSRLQRATGGESQSVYANIFR